MDCRNCGGELKPSAGYKPRVYCSERCRVAHGRRVKRTQKPSKPRAKRITAAEIVPGDRALVERVRALVAAELDADDDVAQAQAALAVRLAELAGDGAVSACRELRLVLLEMRLATDPGYEGEFTQGLVYECLMLVIEGSGPISGREPAGQDLPPGWISTAESGQVLHYLGRRWYELRDADDRDALVDLEKWVGAHTVEIASLRKSGRWSTWPDRRDSL